jgi:hypothetical protein
VLGENATCPPQGASSVRVADDGGAIVAAIEAASDYAKRQAAPTVRHRLPFRSCSHEQQGQTVHRPHVQTWDPASSASALCALLPSAGRHAERGQGRRGGAAAGRPLQGHTVHRAAAEQRGCAGRGGERPRGAALLLLQLGCSRELMVLDGTAVPLAAVSTRVGSSVGVGNGALTGPPLHLPAPRWTVPCCTSPSRWNTCTAASWPGPTWVAS